MKILVGSKNPVKIESVKEAFEKYYDEVEVTGFSVESNVPAQPYNDETFFGAENRAFELNKINEPIILRVSKAEYPKYLTGGLLTVLFV